MAECVRKNGKVCCQECGGELRPWEDVYFWDTGAGEELVCEDCFDGLLGELSRGEAVQRMGIRTVKAEEICL